MSKLIIVEDNEGLREQMKWALNDEYQVFEADSMHVTLEVCAKERPSLICLDMGLENRAERGLDIINSILSFDRSVKIIVITSNTSNTLGPKAIEIGAFDYLIKPVDIKELKGVLSRADRLARYEKPADISYDSGMIENADFPMIGQSKEMKRIFSTIMRLTKSDANVLVTGESGTGKELCARAIHYHSKRKNEPFVPINCGAIPENLMESVLFGYVKGAFTGADSDKMGLVESSDRGTLFLDEIGDMPKNLQVKLLRFVQDQKLQRIGETQFRSLDVRIIAATNKNQLYDKDNSPLRTDLYYRLSEFEIRLPPLRDRKEDIPLISQSIVERNRKKYDMHRLRMTARAEKFLIHYSWPGNVRELENRINRACITCVNQAIEVDDLQLSDISFTGLTFKEAKHLFEKNYLQSILKLSKGNVSLAAKIAGISRPTFYELMKKNEIPLEKKELQEDH